MKYSWMAKCKNDYISCTYHIVTIHLIQYSTMKFTPFIYREKSASAEVGCYFSCQHFSEDRNVAVNFGSMSLRNAFGDPNDVAVLLFLELNVSVEDAKVELVQESLLHQHDLQISYLLIYFLVALASHRHLIQKNGNTLA